MKRIPIATGVLLVVLSLSLDAWAAEQTHGIKFIENIDLHLRAQDCDPDLRLCLNTKIRARRVGCYPPIVTWSSYGTDPEIVQAKVKVDIAGNVRDVRLVRKSKFDALDKAVVESLMQCRMGVLKVDGVPQESDFEVEFNLHPDKTAVRLVE